MPRGRRLSGLRSVSLARGRDGGRLTLIISGSIIEIISGSIIEHVFYPVFPPGEHAQQVLSWLGNASRSS